MLTKKTCEHPTNHLNDNTERGSEKVKGSRLRWHNAAQAEALTNYIVQRYRAQSAFRRLQFRADTLLCPRCYLEMKAGYDSKNVIKQKRRSRADENVSGTEDERLATKPEKKRFCLFSCTSATYARGDDKEEGNDSRGVQESALSKQHLVVSPHTIYIKRYVSNLRKNILSTLVGHGCTSIPNNFFFEHQFRDSASVQDFDVLSGIDFTFSQKFREFPREF
ncbi:unnamed protein product [Didymodactylos carnosus]|uniref:Uncharacterized protein n=1 Tax=Didymodactylos carnosus TaxID=1234261 RepID=A0A815Z118_9BILA|nr:unnamed protein product [Didymodactylos carnosus]CAF4443265.1 unnamed protein product [Didymodactylos carnosus]